MKSIASMVGKMIKIKQLTLLIVFFLFAFAKITYASSEMGQAGAFLRYGVGGRALGMGRAYVAAANDASAIYWNPAGIVGSSRPEFTSMYTNLYYDSQYAFFGLIYPRILKESHNSFVNYLVGPWSAWGLGWTGLSSAEYDQRSDVGELLGQFGIQENAFHLTWAHEHIHPYGVLKYGLSFKLINQSFSGLEGNGMLPADLSDKNWSGGMDFGFQFQPIHAPVFKLVSLRYLLPLSLGMNFQNLVPPGYQSQKDDSQNFPLMVRWGMKYQFNLSDWIPTSWFWLYDTFSSSHIITTLDWAWVESGGTGRFWGIEGVHPVRNDRTYLYWRTGLNNQSEGPVLGLGMDMPFTHAARLRLDYSYGTHPYLPEDSRFFMTLKFGPNFDDQYFLTKSKQFTRLENEWEDLLLKTLSEYPNPSIREAVELLASECDSSLIPRYFDLIGGLGRAEWLMRDARKQLILGHIRQARHKATQAAEEYFSVYNENEDNLSDHHLLNYGEALVMIESYEDGIQILQHLDKQTLKSHYLIGTSFKKLGRWSKAIEIFSGITKMSGEIDNESIIPLSFLGWGESLMGQSSFESAIAAFKVMLNRYSKKLDRNYPRYPLIMDDYIQDDAQYLIGLSLIQLDQYDAGILELLNVLRYYPDLDYGAEVSNNTNLILEILQNKSWNQLKDYADELYADYLEIH